MVKFIIVPALLVTLISCGVKRPPAPLYSIPSSALSTTPTPSPTPNGK